VTPPGTFERVYAAIKLRFREGAYRPGSLLEPAALSDELNASVTPARDALHRLTGERLVDAPRHEGFRVPTMSETTLRHLYGWHLDLLTLAIGRRRADRSAGGELPHEDPQDQPLDELFARLAASSDNPEHAAALRNLTDGSKPYQRTEASFLDSIEAETTEIVLAVRRQDRAGLRRSLVQYHRGRQRVVPDLLAALHDRAPFEEP
jgi:DNA-binding FadR family transcriptional regulator